MKDWSREEQSKAVISKFGSLFALDNLDLGKTPVVDHSNELTDYTLFNEMYRKMPPSQCEEVKKHLQMLEIGEMKFSYSPWANEVVLVHKKLGTYESVLTNASSMSGLLKMLFHCSG